MASQYRAWLPSIHAITRAVTQAVLVEGRVSKGTLLSSGTIVVVHENGEAEVATPETQPKPGDSIGFHISDRRVDGTYLNAAILMHGTIKYDMLPEESQQIVERFKPKGFTFTQAHRELVEGPDGSYKSTYSFTY